MKLIRLSSQLTFSCAKSQYKNQKKSWNIFKVKKTPEWRQWRRSDVFLVNLNIFHTFF